MGLVELVEQKRRRKPTAYAVVNFRAEHREHRNFYVVIIEVW